MIAELRITPVGTSPEFARLVAQVVRILSESGLQYVVNPMGTSLEGDLEDILDVVRRCHQELRKHAERVLMEISIDDRAGAEGELVRSLEHVRQVGSGLPLERLVRSGTAGPLGHGGRIGG